MSKAVKKMPAVTNRDSVPMESPIDKTNISSPCATSVVSQTNEAIDNSPDVGSHGDATPHIGSLSLDQNITEMKNSDQKSSNQKSASSHSANASVRSNHTIPQPFNLATEKRASSGFRVLAADVGTNGNKHPNVDIQPANIQNKTQQSSIHASRKPLVPNNTMHPVEEDSNSADSSTIPSVKNLKDGTNLAYVPALRCNDRAEKRKEFHSKLEEKQQALEAEKLECEARTREEEEAALKQLRKNLNFKATPMPSFYHEGPPKVELRKVPPTRAKSPKLGRRKSCGDANNLADGRRARIQRNSLGSQKEVPFKAQINARSRNAIEAKSKGENLKPKADKSCVLAAADTVEQGQTDTVDPVQP